MKLALLGITLALMHIQAYAQAIDSPVKTIPSLDVPRYMGTWYEIAKFPNWFQRKIKSCHMCFQFLLKLLF